MTKKTATMRLGADLGGTNLKMGLFDESGTTIRFTSVPVKTLGPESGLWEAICTGLSDFAGKAPLSRAGLSIKGLVGADGELCDDIGLAGLFRGMNLKTDLEKRLGVPVDVANDARSYGWGEYRFGAGRGSTIMVCITLGTGIGCSIVANGRPWMGADPTSGILGGHITIDRNGPECLCGNRGCFEGYCSATALRQRILDRYPELEAADDVIVDYFEQCRRDAGSESILETGSATDSTRGPSTPSAPSACTPASRDVLHAWTDDLALGIVSLIHTTGADTVVVGGGVVEGGDLFMPRLREIVHRRTWTWPRGTVSLKASELGNRAAALGAAFMQT